MYTQVTPVDNGYSLYVLHQEVAHLGIVTTVNLEVTLVVTILVLNVSNKKLETQERHNAILCLSAYLM